ncbi:MAG: ATPase, partial [Mesorhizobium sp.]
MNDQTMPPHLFEAPPIGDPDEYGNVLAFPGDGPEPPATVAEPLPSIDLAAVPVADVPPRKWIVPDLIPDRNVTDLAGDGGLGKSLLALQLGIAMTSGRDWIGAMPEPGGFLYVSCEDEADEILRRRNAILGGMNLAPVDIAGFHLVDLTDADGTELAMGGQHGALELTALYRRLEASIVRLRPKCAVLDTRADVFGGNEISRIHVRGFVRALRRLAIGYDLAIVMISHPSLSGMASGSGQSGSTGWGNSVRSRLYLTAPRSEADAEPDPDIRILSTKKANYGPRGTELTLRWDKGMFRPDGPIAELDRDAQDRGVELRFLGLIEKREKEGRRTNASSGPNYAPKVLAEMDKTIGRVKFKAAMERLFAKGEIVSTPYDVHGKSSSCVVITDAGMRRMRSPF